jgi:sortase family protein
VTADTGLAEYDEHMAHRAIPERCRPSRRAQRLVSVLVITVLAGGAALWVNVASGSDPHDVLGVSKPTTGDPQPGAHGVGRHGQTRPAAVGTEPVPAQVGRPAPSQVDAERPLVITLSSGTTMRVRRSATSVTGALAIPSDIKQAGWWDGGSKLGDPFGAVVIAAHVDSFTQGLGKFAQLLSMKPGDLVTLQSAHLTETFRVVAAGLVPKTSISATSDAFSPKGQPRLVLITCGGQFDPTRGGYQSNMVVVATAKQPAQPLG